MFERRKRPGIRHISSARRFWENARLARAVRKGDWKRAKDALNAGASPNARYGAVFWDAVRQGHLETVHDFLGRGVDLKRPYEMPETNNYGVVILLAKSGYANGIIYNGPRVLTDEPPAAFFNYTPLEKAAVAGDIGAIRAALADGADPNAKGNDGWPVLLSAAAVGQHLAVDYLASCGADIRVYEDAPLRRAAKNEHLETLRMLLSRGADANARGGEPLKTAVRANNLPMVQALLAAGADPRPSFQASREKSRPDACAPQIVDALRAAKKGWPRP